MTLEIRPLIPDRWDDLVELFGRPGASIARGCYCMCYRRSGKHEIPAGLTYSEDNRRALKELVARGGFVEVARRRPTRPVMRRSLRVAGDRPG